jgi:glycosyltransferase involved in cell wall biosynthesis
VRIALSLLSLRPGQVGGAETYVRALVRHLPEVAGGDELLLVLDRDIDREIVAPGWTRVVMPYGARELVARRIAEAYTPWRDWVTERVLQSARPDVTLFPQQSIFPHRAPGAAVLGVGDVQHLFFPEKFGLFDRTFRPRVYPRSMERAVRIISVSDFTRRTLTARCGVPAQKVVVIHHGVDRDDSAVRPLPLASGRVEGPYLYCPAATWPHKGHGALLRCYAALRRSNAVVEKLVLTGQRTPLWERTLLPMTRDLGIDRDVVHLGFVSFDEVRRLHAGAAAVVFPTTFEGFGLPVLEAIQAGGKVITSRLEVFDEIGVPQTAQADFEKPDEVLAALARPGPTRLLREPETWAQVARRTLEVVRAGATAILATRPPDFP